MKKIYLIAFAAFFGATAVNAQSKQAVNATQMASGSTLQAQQSHTLQYQPAQTQTVSGYYQQGFEGSTFAPAGWNVFNVAGPSYTWVRSTAQAHNSTASAYMRYDATAGGGQDWLVAPRFNVTASTDSLVFWMRLAFAGYQPDSLCIKVSTTDSLTSSFGNNTLLKLMEGTNYPTNSTTWYRYAVSLSNYVGQTIYLAFKHYNVDGDGLYIDDVSIGTAPATEVGTYAITAPSTGLGAGTYAPAASFTNYGTATQTFNVTAEITPGGYTSTQTVTALAPAANTPVTFGNWTATPGTYTLKVYTQLSGDANHYNDTLTRVLTVYPAFTNYGWDAMTALPAGRWATGPVFARPCLSSTDTGFVYLIGGGDASFANTNLNTRYNTVTGTYANMAALPTSRTQISPVQVNGKIYVIGGYTGSFTPTTLNDIYDIATNTWSSGAVLPTAVGDYAIGVYNDSLIYVVGGYNGSGDVNLVQIYDTYNNTWTAGTPKTGAAVAGGRMGIAGNTIVFMGGYSQTLAATQSLAYSGVINPSAPATITWTSLPNFPGGTTGRHGGGVAFENTGLVYFAAGDPNGQGTSAITSVFAYNTVLNQWEIGPNIPVGVSNINSLAGAVVNDSLFLISMGGYNGTAVVSSNQWLNIGPAAALPFAQNDTAMCMGSTMQLNGYNGQSYMWSPAASLNDATVANPVSSATTTTTYTVTMTKSYGCPVTDMVTLTVNPLPSVVANTTMSAVCAGDAVTLSGSGATSYSWTNSVTDNVAFVPAMTNTYTVTGTDANGCTNTDMVTVTVNPLPAVVANTTASAVCAGNTVTLTGSGATSYTWTGNVTDNVAFAPTMTDTYTVTGTDGNGCNNTDMVTVTVNALPTIVAMATADSVCNGSSVTLMGGGATSYSWTGNVTDNVAFVPAMTDTYTVTGTDANGCSDTASIMITVNALPTVVANASAGAVCEGSPVTLSGSGATSYSWTGNVTDNVSFVPVMTDTYTVTGTDANGCTNTDEITVTVNPNPTVTVSLSMDTICDNGGLFTLNGASPAGGTWSGTGVTGSSFDPMSAPGASTTIMYSYTDNNGCSGTASDAVYVETCSGIASFTNDNVLNIFPNPTNGNFTIQLTTVPAAGVTVEITNELGQVIDAFTMTSSSKEVSLASMNSGVYFVRLISEGHVTVQRVVKH